MNYDRWVPGCGGTEKPFTVNNVRLLWCWNQKTGEHAYIDLDRDVVLTTEEYLALVERR